MVTSLLPPLPENLEPTRASLHAYALAVGALPRVHALSHPKWWHVSLRVRPSGLITEVMPMPGGGTFQVRMDLRNHEIVIDRSDGSGTAFSMASGATGTEMGDALIAAVADMGLAGDYDREKFESDELREYDAAAAECFFDVLTSVGVVLERHRSTLEGDIGPLQLWPHGFDVAFEWFGTRVERYEEHGEVQEYPSQLNLGFYPAGRAYFYSNPWPFEEAVLADRELPSGAEWHTERWQGSILYYDVVAGKPDADELVLAYARAVHEVAAPTLMA